MLAKGGSFPPRHVRSWGVIKVSCGVHLNHGLLDGEVSTHHYWKQLKASEIRFKGLSSPPKNGFFKCFFVVHYLPPNKRIMSSLPEQKSWTFSIWGRDITRRNSTSFRENGFFQLLISRKATHQQHQVSKQGNDHHSIPILRRQVCSWLPCPSGRTLNEASSCPWWSSGTRFRWTKKRCFFVLEIWGVGSFFFLLRFTVEKMCRFGDFIYQDFFFGHEKGRSVESPISCGCSFHLPTGSNWSLVTGPP